MATVLVADHHPADAEVAAALLTADGYAVRCVGDGAAALALVRRWRPDAVLAEVLLPGGDGLALAARLRRQGIPTVLTSATFVICHPALPFVAKPVDAAALRAELARALAGPSA